MRTLELILAVAALAATVCIVSTVLGRGTTWSFDPALVVRAPLDQPMDALLVSGNRLAVSDAGLGEVLLFDHKGEVVWRTRGPAAAPFDHPGGLIVEGGEVWVADAGNGRIVRLDLDSGAVTDSIPLRLTLDELVASEQAVVPTDLALDEDALWIADSTHDRVLRVEPSSGEVLDLFTRPLGRDEAFESPRSLHLLGDGSLAVVEALAARVVILDRSGSATQSIGIWGTGEGRFIKPKAVSGADAGGLLILDSYQGILQWLAADGSFVQVAAKEGAILTWAHPLAIDSAGDRVAVVDPGRAEVTTYTLRRVVGDPPGIPMDQDLLRGLVSFDGDMSGACYQCHDGTARLTSDRWNADAVNHPLEVDHPQMVASGMKLDSEGNLGCTSCHHFHEDDAYVDPTVYDVLGEQVRREELPLGGTEFCYLCHQDHRDFWVERDMRRNHPVDVSLLATADLDAIVGAGGKLSASSDRLVACDTCHRIHGSEQEHLLVLEPTSAELCMPCHQGLGEGTGRHPLEMALDEEGAARVAGYGGKLGPEGEVACMSCHDPHMASSARLLRIPNTDGSLCVACHADKQGVRSGAHKGVTGAAGAANAGPCGGCHAVHTPVTLPVAGSERADGLSRHCLGCHDPSAPGKTTKVHTRGPHMFRAMNAGATADLPLYAGRIGCSTCHDGHSSSTALLRKKEEGGRLCLACHPGRSTVIGTDHDASMVAPEGQGGTETCTSCHSNHDPRGDFLFSREARPADNPADGRCMACHDERLPGATTKIRHYKHDRNLLLTVAGLPASFGDEVPIFDDQGRRTDSHSMGSITCLTCHDPHRWRHDSDEVPGAPSNGRATTSFLRDPKRARKLCASCHGKEALTRYNFFHRDTYRKEAP